MFILDFRITHQCLRSEPTRLYVAATDHSECIGRSASGSDRSQRHPLRVYWRICVKIFVSPTEFCRHNKSHKFCLIWFFCDMLLRQNYFCCRAKIFTKILQCTQSELSLQHAPQQYCCNLLSSVYWPLYFHENKNNAINVPWRKHVELLTRPNLCYYCKAELWEYTYLNTCNLDLLNPYEKKKMKYKFNSEHELRGRLVLTWFPLKWVDFSVSEGDLLTHDWLTTRESPNAFFGIRDLRYRKIQDFKHNLSEIGDWMYVWEVGYHQDYRIALDFWSGLRNWITLSGASDRVSDFQGYNRAVTKISSFRVNAVIRRGIVQLGNSFVSIFLLFSMKVAEAHGQSSRGKSPVLAS